MACFLVSTVEAAAVIAAKKGVEKSEGNHMEQGAHDESLAGIPLSRKLSWLSKMLLGGSVLLAFEHVWHGEVVPWFPFLTAMSNPHDAAEMLHEMATVGASMAAVITAAWGAVCVTADGVLKKAAGKAQKA